MHRPSDSGQIDNLVNRFFSAFDNRNGRTPDYGNFSRCFADGATITVKKADQLHTWDLMSFWQPRFELLTGGRLKEFWEWETESDTRILGELAVHLCSYCKDGLLDGERYRGRGSKCFHLARIGADWRIVSILWEDLE